MGVDIGVVALLTLAAQLSRTPAGALSLGGRVCLALAFTSLIRISWQFNFYLRTDLYYLFTTATDCVDLHSYTLRMLGNRVRRLLGRPDRYDESTFPAADRRVGRWYGPLIVVGYASSFAMLAAVFAPLAYHFVGAAIGRLDGRAGTAGVVDSAAFLGLNLAQLALIVVLRIRARRSRVAPGVHVLS
jgi:hypothetical protein